MNNKVQINVSMEPLPVAHKYGIELFCVDL